MNDGTNVQEKLEKLRSLRPDLRPQSKAVVDAWDQRISELTVKSDYVELDTSREILRHAKEMIQIINDQLSNDATLPDRPTVAAGLHAAKQVWFYIVALYSRDYNRELQSIEGMVDFELERR